MTKGGFLVGNFLWDQSGCVAASHDPLKIPKNKTKKYIMLFVYFLACNLILKKNLKTKITFCLKSTLETKNRK